MLVKQLISMRPDSAIITSLDLRGKRIKGCAACYRCQGDPVNYGCIIKDDMQDLVTQILDSDLMIWATPIYEWSVPSPLKALWDRMFGLYKYYQLDLASGLYTKIKGVSLNAGKRIALLTTSGYPANLAADLLDETLKRYARYARMDYRGLYGVQSGRVNDMTVYEDKEVIAGLQLFWSQMLQN